MTFTINKILNKLILQIKFKINIKRNESKRLY